MASSDKLLVSLEDGVKRITINRPERRNSVDVETVELLHEAIQRSAEDDSKVVILTGAGDAFCAGADLQATSERDIKSVDVTASLREHTNPTILAMRSLSKPIIARVHGHAVGVGCNYALACDIVIASEQAKFGQVFVKIGLMPDGGSTFFLPRTVGYAKAFELMATGDIISARDALGLGLVNRVVAFEELDTTVDAMAARLAQAAPIALRKIKEGLNHGLNSDLASALDFEAVNQGDCFQSDDFMEGVKAFLEKRKAQFQGR
ncbi:MAG: 2-(1,2-epoxy-1,2-dihydrophenyl)acetyl-CoA isomerase [Acidobacteria bacterium]|nr:MAG: 2-(1,2-epoxy-1,2-dihydrophenyl)acetyl-CoA isomerase [Acidobacteriota bacterium]